MPAISPAPHTSSMASTPSGNDHRFGGGSTGSTGAGAVTPGGTGGPIDGDAPGTPGSLPRPEARLAPVTASPHSPRPTSGPQPGQSVTAPRKPDCRWPSPPWPSVSPTSN